VNARLIGTGIGTTGTLVAAAAFAFAGSAVLRQDKTSRARTVFTGKLLEKLAEASTGGSR